jgi:hypothetical protein
MRLGLLRKRLLTIATTGTALGSLASACTSTVIVEGYDDDGSGTGGTNATSGSGAGPTTTGTGGAPATTTSSSTGTTPTTLTCAPDHDAPGMGDPWGLPDQCFTAEQLAGYVNGPMPADVGVACDGGVLCPSTDMLVEYEPGCSEFTGDVYSVDGDCCYAISCYCCGRPMTVDGQARRAAATRRGDWAEAITASGEGDREALSEDLRLALRDAWLDDALLEHASVASFARFTLQLMALGAPSWLVEASQQASLDEVRHARDCFALASRYADAPLGPTQLPLHGALVETSLADAVAATIIEGCIGETIASAMAAEQLHHACDPQARATLERIVEDEARHAELAWTFVRWAMETGGATIANVVRETFDAQRAHVEATLAKGAPPSTIATDDEARWHHHGRLLPRESSAVTRAALDEVILPCAEALQAPRAA